MKQIKWMNEWMKSIKWLNEKNEWKWMNIEMKWMNKWMHEVNEWRNKMNKMNEMDEWMSEANEWIREPEAGDETTVFRCSMICTTFSWKRGPHQ